MPKKPSHTSKAFSATELLFINLNPAQYVIALGLMFLLFTSLSAMCLACNSSDLIPLLGKYHARVPLITENSFSLSFIYLFVLLSNILEVLHGVF